jgi:hypothetical protein
MAEIHVNNDPIPQQERRGIEARPRRSTLRPRFNTGTREEDQEQQEYRFAVHNVHHSLLSRRLKKSTIGLM